MKHHVFYGVALASLCAAAACSDDMDYNEYNIYEKDFVEGNFSYTGALLTKIYNDIDTDWGNYSGAMLSSATDESEYSHSGNAIEDFYNGSWSPSNAKSSIWTSAYEGITYCNEFLDNWLGLEFDELKLNSDYQKQMYRYHNYQFECRWARAYFYFTLVRQYGGVPFKEHNTTAGEETALPRATADEIFDFIDAECAAIQDSIIKDYSDLGDMALTGTEIGRANQLAVMALRARAALYHASPLFNTSNDAARWEHAATVCRSLVDSCTKQGKKLDPSYTDLWTGSTTTSQDAMNEIIFTRITAASRTMEAYNFPVNYSTGGGGNCPTQSLVDAYEMTNGLAIDDPDSGYDPQNPYTGRDPRLGFTVAVNGEAWPTDLPNSNSSYTTLQTYVGGFHGRPTTSYATPTSYYLKKLLNSSQILRSGYATTSYHNWLTFRLGEVYLNMAEAQFQYFKAMGRTDAADYTSTAFPTAARTWASRTRDRSGVKMPAFAAGLSNDEFWAKLKNERRVELAFEGHRFFDVRRWKEADESKKFMVIKEMQITKDDATGDLTYTPVTVTRGDGQFQDKWYLFPIPQSEIMKSDGALTQNPGW